MNRLIGLLRRLLLSMAVLLLLPGFGTNLIGEMTVYAAETSGTCGEDATWNFDPVTGKLTIEGSGQTYDYFNAIPSANQEDKRAPWYKYYYG
ncbi:MAG: hypothetical protein J6P60_00125, partial [Lachnospiraceae bacterium]|nr:hypothetical protein [Lachnospiraceae bacterium]